MSQGEKRIGGPDDEGGLRIWDTDEHSTGWKEE